MKKEGRGNCIEKIQWTEGGEEGPPTFSEGDVEIENRVYLTSTLILDKKGLDGEEKKVTLPVKRWEQATNLTCQLHFLRPRGRSWG